MKTRIEVGIVERGRNRTMCFETEETIQLRKDMEVELFDGSASVPVQIIFFRVASMDVLVRLRSVFVNSAEEAEELIESMLADGWKCL